MAAMKTTADQQLVKRINRSVLLRLLRSQPGLSRAQLASHSGLTKSTVSLLVRELLEEGWLSEPRTDSADSSEAAPGLGRPSTPLQINALARGLIGVEIAVDCLRVVWVSLLGDVMWSAEQALDSRLPSEVCRQTADLVRLAWLEMKRSGLRLSAVGIGLPGAFDEATGVVRFAPNLGWRDVDFLTEMTEALLLAGLPRVHIAIQNEADTAALSEYEFASGESESSLIFVTCDVGVGAGIVLNDRLFTGAHGLAGEIGHTIMQIDGPLCSCGRRGCAETFIGARRLPGETGLAAERIAQAGRFLGVLMQNLWTSFNPHVLVVGGPSCVRHPALVQAARQTLQTYAQMAGMDAPAVRTAHYGLLASAVGAGALVLHQYLRPMHGPVRKLLPHAKPVGQRDAGLPVPPTVQPEQV
jgi:predicted NBD/HSP70 family sugar kinase